MKLKHLQFYLILIDADTWLQEPTLRAHTLRNLSASRMPKSK